MIKTSIRDKINLSESEKRGVKVRIVKEWPKKRIIIIACKRKLNKKVIRLWKVDTRVKKE